jgi:hypothetical protein
MEVRGNSTTQYGKSQKCIISESGHGTLQYTRCRHYEAQELKYFVLGGDLTRKLFCFGVDVTFSSKFRLFRCLFPLDLDLREGGGFAQYSRFLGATKNKFEK